MRGPILNSTPLPGPTIHQPRPSITQHPPPALAIEHFLPEGLAASTIANAAGISRSALYIAEDDLGVDRRKKALRVNVATATKISFIKVFDADGKYVATLSGADAALAQD